MSRTADVPAATAVLMVAALPFLSTVGLIAVGLIAKLTLGAVPPAVDRRARTPEGRTGTNPVGHGPGDPPGPPRSPEACDAVAPAQRDGDLDPGT